ncbi:MAG: restriction endonuclease [Candidatus Riflebacteria bacterium HGW-Riflebacteria-1]|jgi:putative restriction endonuclease|nr:MAG: restriction endonuclease [Candidatus Riflebacteria bacterium HGW-Riflebacteria-1]
MTKHTTGIKESPEGFPSVAKEDAINAEAIIRKFSGLKIWSNGDQRAPHKPLLILLALANCQQGRQRLMPYAEINVKLKQLLEDFGPARRSIKTVSPFWRLTTDGLWDIPRRNEITVQADGDPSKQILLSRNICGGFPEDMFEFLSRRPEIISQLAREILTEHFPESIHDDIILSIGLQTDFQGKLSQKIKRDPDFRNKILTVYQYQCAICGFDMRLGNNPVCLEAAHIKWHQAGGPAIEQNGIALCSMHHKMFDRGVFSINENYCIKTSKHINGSCGLEEWLYRYEDKQILLPRSKDYSPARSFTEWHFREVFKHYEA